MDHCKKIKWFDEVDSTNTRLIAEKDAMCSGTIYSALFQTSGRGQKGNSWLAGKGENLTFSLLFKPSALQAERQFVISQATAVAISQYLEGLGITPKIKWPNDILSGGKKICGILIENSLSDGRISSSVIGIGLNVNQLKFQESLSRATSAALETGLKFDIREELEKLSDALLENLEKLETPEDARTLHKNYMDRLYGLGEWREYIDRSDCDTLIPTTERVDGVKFRGKIKDILENGCLLLENEKGEDKTFAFKQLSYIF